MPNLHDDHDDPTPSAAPAADVTPAGQEHVRRERELPCSAEEAWSLLRDADGLERWLADDVELVVAPGEEGTIRDGDDTLVVLVEDVEDGRRVSLRWWSGDGEPSFVDLTVDPIDHDRSRLVVTEAPLRVVSAPRAVPVDWTAPGGGPGSTGPQALALVR